MKLNRLSCGACGNNSHFNIYSDDDTFCSFLVVECLYCGSTTMIAITTPRMGFSYAEKDSRGMLFHMYSDTKDFVIGVGDG